MTGYVMSRQDLDFLLRAAVQAPSMHNTQPWLFRVRGNVIEIFLDPARALPAEDPEHRAALISSGAVVLNLCVAAASRGRTAEVVADPGPDLAEPVAVVTVAMDPMAPMDPVAAVDPVDPMVASDVGEAAASRIASLAALYPSVSKRRTNRYPFADEPLPSETSDLLSEAAAAEGATLEWAHNPVQQWRLQNLAALADLEDTLDADRAAERARWIGGVRDQDGVPSESLGPRSRQWTTLVRDLAAGTPDRTRPSENFEPHPALAVLATGRDTPADWVAAGRALQRVLLTATARGLSVSLLNQALEHRDLRWLTRDPLHGRGIPQAVLRFGRGPQVPATPRRAPEKFLIGDTESGDHGPGRSGSGRSGSDEGVKV